MMRWLDRGLLTLAPIIKTHVDTFTYSLSNSRPKQFHFPPAHPRLALYLQKDLHHQPLKLKTEVWQSPWWWFHVHQQPHHLPCGSGSLPVMCAINANRDPICPERLDDDEPYHFKRLYHVVCSVAGVQWVAGQSLGYGVPTAKVINSAFE